MRDDGDQPKLWRPPKGILFNINKTLQGCGEKSEEYG